MTALTDWTAGQRRMLLSRCDSCDATWYLPRDRCPACWSSRQHLLQSSGNGMCVAATTLHVTAADVDSDPIRLCLVELEGGAVTMGRAQVGVQPGALVRLEFVTVDDQLLPSFALRG